MTRSILRMVAILVVGVVPAFLFSGCASIMQGTTQSVGISSDPSSAQVSVNGSSLGRTPLVTDLKRKDHHIVRIELDGHAPHETTLSRGVSGWVAGNIVFGGLIGLAVDAITGGMYKLTPEQISATMGRQVVGEEDDMLYIAVVLEADPEWERVSQMERVGSGR